MMTVMVMIMTMISDREAGAVVIKEEGVTVLHSASSNGNMESVRLLLEGGCSVNAQTR